MSVSTAWASQNTQFDSTVRAVYEHMEYLCHQYWQSASFRMQRKYKRFEIEPEMFELRRQVMDLLREKNRTSIATAEKILNSRIQYRGLLNSDLSDIRISGMVLKRISFLLCSMSACSASIGDLETYFLEYENRTMFPSEYLRALQAYKAYKDGNPKEVMKILNENLEHSISAIDRMPRKFSQKHPRILSYDGKKDRFLFNNVLLDTEYYLLLSLCSFLETQTGHA